MVKLFDKLKQSKVFKKIELPFSEIPHFSQRDKAYQESNEILKPFYKHEVNIDRFEKVIEERQSFQCNRALLHSVLLQQYQSLPNSEQSVRNIDKLKEKNCYTVITAHQPSLLTGPLYYIIKICSTINLAQQLNKKYSELEIVPVFIVGGEDHDFEEIASVNFFGKKFTWETDQKGAVGRMDISDLSIVLEEVKNTFGSMPFAEDLKTKIDQCYKVSDSYGDFMRRLTHSIFGSYGLIVANMDHYELKKAFFPIVKKEIESNISFKEVNVDQKKIEAAGLKKQAHAREVNLFYHDLDRHRIIKVDKDQYEIGEHTYTRSELIQLIEHNVQNISPNVILRPVFQELIFPNLAYIGGGGELAYWMERISLFEKLELPFPMLIRRDSVLISDANTENTLEKFGLSFSDLFDREEQLIIHVTKEESTVDLSLDPFKSELIQIFDKVRSQVQAVDKTLVGTVNAEQSKSLKSLENIENKILKAEKRKKETETTKIKKIKSKLFPGNNSLQERHDNFIPYYLKYGPKWIDHLIDSVDPLDKNFKILVIQ